MRAPLPVRVLALCLISTRWAPLSAMKTFWVAHEEWAYVTNNTFFYVIPPSDCLQVFGRHHFSSMRSTQIKLCKDPNPQKSFGSLEVVIS